MNKVMVIAPHHDDEVIGCGGTIYRHQQNGDQVVIVFMVAGWSGIFWEEDRQTASAIIQAEAKRAAAALTVGSVIELNLEDRNLSFETAAPLLIQAIRAERPDVIYLPHAADGDREHRLVHEIAREAIWQAATDYFPNLGIPTDTVKMILGYEVWRPIASYSLAIDISGAIEAKSQALACYKSQLKLKDWLAAAIGLNRYRGITSGKGEYAEVFTVLKINEQSII